MMLHTRATMRGTFLAGMLIVIGVATAVVQAQQRVVEVAAGAERIVTATVSEVDTTEAVNEFGDRLIVSRATLVVEEVLKGAAVDTLTLYVEGGTLGDITLHVSDMPLILTGDRGVFFVGRTSSGLDVPHRRGRGILILDADDLVTGTGLSLNDIRSQVVQP